MVREFYAGVTFGQDVNAPAGDESQEPTQTPADDESEAAGAPQEGGEDSEGGGQ